MKKGFVSKLGGAALVLSLVTASLVGGTFAKYTKEVTGNASVKVAKFNLDTTDVATLNFGKISPDGNSVTQEIEITSDSDVAVDGTIEVTLGTGLPQWAKMTIKAEGDSTDTALTAGTAVPLSFSIAANTTTPKKYIITCTTTDTPINQSDAATINVAVKVSGGQQ